MKFRNMTVIKKLREKLSESIASVIPVTAIVLIMAISFVPLESGPILLFLFGALLLLLGMALFTLGADMSMMPMGEGIGESMGKARHKIGPMALCFALGVLITIAEPDLTVLANQIPPISNMVIIVSVAVGVGLFLVFSLLRTALGVPLTYILLFFYALVFVLAIFTPTPFIPVSFDAGGVTTGPVTVPFMLSLGSGLALTSGKKSSLSDSFGMVAMCSIGPIISTMILGLVYNPQNVVPTEVVVPDISTARDAAYYFVTGFPEYFLEVAKSLAPIAGLFLLFELFTRRFKRHQLFRMISGFVYTYLGLVLFLTAANVGFMPVGHLLGREIAAGAYKWLLVPVGMAVGYFLVAAEPAVHVLKKQVEEVSGGTISARSLLIALSAGVATSVGIAMLRLLTGVSVLWFLVPGYAISLALSFFVPRVFTGVAFDAGGVASGPMTTAFLLPLAMGACTALGGDILADAFGIVAMVAMTPLLTIQILGFTGAVRRKISGKMYVNRLGKVNDCIVYFD